MSVNLILMDSQAKEIHMTNGEHRTVQVALGYLNPWQLLSTANLSNSSMGISLSFHTSLTKHVEYRGFVMARSVKQLHNASGYAATCISLLGGYQVILPFPTDLSSHSQRALKQNYP